MKETVMLIFDVINFGLLAFLWWFTVRNYRDLPEAIPVHFDFEGKPDRYGSKKYAFLTPVIGTLFYILLAYVIRDPGSANYPVKITDDNREAQFLIMQTFIRWFCTLGLLIFLNSQDYGFRYSADNSVKPKVPMTTAFLTIIGSLVVLFVFVGIFK